MQTFKVPTHVQIINRSKSTTNIDKFLDNMGGGADHFIEKVLNDLCNSLDGKPFNVMTFMTQYNIAYNAYFVANSTINRTLFEQMSQYTDTYIAFFDMVR